MITQKRFFDIRTKEIVTQFNLTDIKYMLEETGICMNGGCFNPIFGSLYSLSRKDNSTKICPQCGTMEAVRDFQAVMHR